MSIDAPPAETQTHRGYCVLCRSRCGAIYTTSGGRLVDVKPDAAHPTGGALCSKGRAAPELTHHRERLLRPMRRTNPKGSADPGWVPIDYDEALDEIAERMAAITAAEGAQAVAFGVTTPSGSPISDSIEWIQRLAWQLGSPNMLAAVEVCNFQKDYAQALTFGRELGVPDYARADTIVLWGHNPARTWLAEARIIADARRRGARLVVIDPKRSGSGEDADLWLRVRPGTDAALAMGAIRAMLASGSVHDRFVREWTDAPFLIDLASRKRLRAPGDDGKFLAVDRSGRFVAVDPRAPSEDAGRYDLHFRGTMTDADGHEQSVATAFALLAERAAPWTPSRVAAATGIPEAQLAEFDALLAGSPRIAYYHWTGTAQSEDATQTTRAISSLFALRDDVDCAGGNRWLAGPQVRQIADPSLLTKEQRRLALGLDLLPLGPPSHGYVTARDLCTAIESNHPYPVRALLSFGANMLSSHPDARRTERALRALEFHVHCDLFVSPMADHADILLPVTAPWEHEALRIGFEISEAAVAHVQLRRQIVDPPGDARPDYAIARGLGARLFPDDALWTGSLREAWDQVLAPVGLSANAVQAQAGGISVAIDQVERRHALASGPDRTAGFATPSGRIEFYSNAWPNMAMTQLPMPPETVRDPNFPILLTTAKSGYFTHSSLRNITSLRRRSADPAIDISPALARQAGLIEGDWARVTSTLGSIGLRVRIDADLADDVAIAEYGWWQGTQALGRGDQPSFGPGSASVNAIIGDGQRDGLSGSPPLRRTFCRIERDDALSRGLWSGQRSFRVQDKQLLGRDVMRIRLRPDDGRGLPRFFPGQHIGISFPGTEGQRYYSLISDGHEADSWEIAVRRNPNAAPGTASLSRVLHDAVPIGSEAKLTPPAGSFVIAPSGNRPVICIAGGIGITPFLGAMRAYARAPAAPHLQIHYVAPSREAAVFVPELTALADRIPQARFTLWPRDEACTETGWPDRGVAAVIGSIDAALLAMRPHIYLCGPLSLMDAARAAFVARGVPSSDVIAEIFKSDTPIPPDLAPVIVSLARQDRQFLWTRESGTILDAATAAGIDLPSGCRVGQCESCAVRVSSGRFVNTVDSELPADMCLTCRAFPLDPLTLDL